MTDKNPAASDWYRIPRKEFSLLPFWFWNDELSECEIDRQMQAFKEKGIDGFVIHPRMGLPDSIPYLSDRWFHFVEYAVKGAARRDMTVVLYDEAMYPSGSCHGRVVAENPAFASQGLQLQRGKAAEAALFPEEKLVAEFYRSGEKIRFVQRPSRGSIRGIHYGEDDGEEGAPKSADLLNPQAVAAFINLTHEAYYRRLKSYFGSTIRAFFTDEPNILGRCAEPGLLPWSDGIFEEFTRLGASDRDLYLLFAEGEPAAAAFGDKDGLTAAEKERLPLAKSLYQKTIYQRLSASYYQQLSRWCTSHGIALTGHPEKSTDIGYLQHFQVPCQDIVWRFVAPGEDSALVGEHSTMGKCSSDSARHRGKARNGNECFGCCGHPDNPKLFTKEDFLWYANWLFARGVNLLYPHAFYYSLREKRGDERPPEVGMHSPFWPEYKSLSDYVKRMCALNSGAATGAALAVLCGAEELSWQIARPLFTHQIAFNYLEAELLPSCQLEAGACRIAGESYRVIVRDRLFDRETEAALSRFEAAGGRVLLYTDDDSLLAALSSLPQPVSPCVDCAPACPDLRASPLKKDGQAYIILTNEGLSPLSCRIHSPSGIRSVYDALADREVAAGNDDFELLLPPYESRVLFLAHSEAF